MSTSTYTSSASAPTTSLLHPSSSVHPIQLSTSAALGIGFAAGVIGVIILLSAGLFMYRCWKVRQSPAVQHYEQARLWKGFTPATPSTIRTTLVDPKMANMYFAELRSPARPSFMPSPLGKGTGQSWPGTPVSPRMQRAELPV